MTASNTTSRDDIEADIEVLFAALRSTSCLRCYRRLVADFHKRWGGRIYGLRLPPPPPPPEPFVRDDGTEVVVR